MKNRSLYKKVCVVLSLILVFGIVYSIFAMQGVSLSAFFDKNLAQVFRNRETLKTVGMYGGGTTSTTFSGQVILNSTSAINSNMSLLRSINPALATSLTSLISTTILDQRNYISLKITKGSVAEATVHWPNCTVQVEPANVGAMASLYKIAGGPCGPTSVAKSIIKVFDLPAEVYADGKNFKQSFLDGIVKSETTASLDSAKVMHQNYSYNGSTFSCGTVFGPTDMTASQKERETQFKDVCGYINDRLAEDQDCSIGLFNAVDNPTSGHMGMINSVTYNNSTKTCQVSISAPGTDSEWKANDYNTGPHSPGNDTWDIKVGSKGSGTFPFKMTPVKTGNNKMWAKEGYKHYNYFCCKKVAI